MVEATDATVGVETMENATKPIRKPKATECFRILGKTGWRVEFGNVADVENASNSSCTEQRLLAQSWASELS